MSDRETCFECCGRKWVHRLPCPAVVHHDGFCMEFICPRCSGSGFDPESDRYRTEQVVVSE